jgi:hypothetical protein
MFYGKELDWDNPDRTDTIPVKDYKSIINYELFSFDANALGTIGKVTKTPMTDKNLFNVFLKLEGRFQTEEWFYYTKDGRWSNTYPLLVSRLESTKTTFPKDAAYISMAFTSTRVPPFDEYIRDPDGYNHLNENSRSIPGDIDNSNFEELINWSKSQMQDHWMADTFFRFANNRQVDFYDAKCYVSANYSGRSDSSCYRYSRQYEIKSDHVFIAAPEGVAYVFVKDNRLYVSTLPAVGIKNDSILMNDKAMEYIATVFPDLP